MNKKIELILVVIAVIQILLLINMPFASSYMIYKSTEVQKENNIDKKDNSSNKGLSMLISFFTIKQIGFVSAAETNSWCCLETKAGAICQDIPNGDYETCKGSPILSSCDKTSTCQKGTCVDEENGICSVSTKYECEEDWNIKPIDQVDKCTPGCCTLKEGTEKEYVRQVRCEKEGGIHFDPTIKQEDCRLEVTAMGACVFLDNCQFTTSEDCENNLKGIFNRGVLCSNPELETKCEKPASKLETRTACYNSKVYFLDTCGNTANVYNSEKWDDEEYWKFAENPECDADLTDIDSLKSCGNCNGVNSICASSESGVNPEYGSYACRDLNCEDAYFKSRFKRDPYNRESWCIYESYVGNSKDVVGSEYRVAYCDRGTVKIDLCENYRGKVCGESNITDSSGAFLSVARCRNNEGWKCYNSKMKKYKFTQYGWFSSNAEREETEEDNKEKCEKTSSDCTLKQVDLYFNPGAQYGSSSGYSEFNVYKFDMCVPKYNPGLKFWDSESNTKDVCGSINPAKCTTVWQKTGSVYLCKGNCACLSKEYANQMNNLCTSLGDCGAKANIVGVYTSGGAKIWDKDDLNKDKFELHSYFYTYNPNSGVYEKYPFESDRLEGLADGKISNVEKEEYISYADYNQIGKGEPPKYYSLTEEGLFGGDPLEGIDSISDLTNTWGTTTGIVVGAVGAGIALLAMAVGGPIGIIVAAIVLVIVAIVEVILWAFGGFENPIVLKIEFRCRAWQAPMGGDDCSKCDDDPLRPCTEYKCKSLGATCALADNIASENLVCINKYPNDVIPPQISFSSIEDEEEYNINEKTNGLDIKSYDMGCIQEFSLLNFTLNTTDGKGEGDYARCVYNWMSGVAPPNVANDYELNGEEFSEGNFYSVTHRFNKRLPFLSDTDKVSKVSGTVGERTGEANMYVRCMDYAGNSNINEYIVKFCVKEGPDNTAAKINEYLPEDKSSIAYKANTSTLIISVNKPVDCKWTHDIDKEYDAMEGTMLCEDYTGEMKLSWDCSTELTNLNKDENKIYIKCKDQPWISEEGYDGPWTEENRNVNAQGALYTLYASLSELKIDSVSPQGAVVRGEKDLSGINLYAVTSGGAFNGKATCRYEFTEPAIGGDEFFETRTTQHKQPLSSLFSGDYNILISCDDVAGNTAEKSISLSMSVDTEAPKIVRAYKEGEKLKLVTEEQAKCYYDTEKCYFGLEDKEKTDYEMTNVLSTVHSAPWTPGVTYYIKCVDKFGNSNPDCSQKISPGS